MQPQEEQDDTLPEFHPKPDRFSKGYKNVFQGATSRISSLFVRPEPQPTAQEPLSESTLHFKKFRSVKRFPSGSQLSHIEALSITAIKSGDGASAHKPSGISTKEWFAINSYIMYNSVVYFYGWLNEDCCTQLKCPKMVAGSRFEFRWTDGLTSSIPKNVPAVEYTKHLLDWIEYQFRDPTIFPSYDGAYYSRHRFIPVVQDIFRRLLRVYAHLLNHHLEDLKRGQLYDEFISYLKHFMDLFDRFDLLEEKDLKPVLRSVEWFNVVNRVNVTKTQ